MRYGHGWEASAAASDPMRSINQSITMRIYIAPPSRSLLGVISMKSNDVNW